MKYKIGDKVIYRSAFGVSCGGTIEDIIHQKIYNRKITLMKVNGIHRNINNVIKVLKS